MSRGLRSGAALDVCWAGPRPSWLKESDVVTGLDGITFVDATAAAVVHLPPGTRLTLDRAKSGPGRPAVVVDLGVAAAASLPADLGAADTVLVDSAWDADQLAARQPDVAGRIAVAPAPVDLLRFAPQPELLKAHGSQLKRFKRFHRLAEPCLLFVGPYTPKGGLDLAIEAVFALRDRFADVRLTAIPFGPIDHAFLDKCERRALGLGHRGIVEWQVDDLELPFWYATASVVCTPWRDWSGTFAPLRFAAAAGRPFVGSDLVPLRAELATGAGWATLVRTGDPQGLVDACSAIFEKPELANEQGATAREFAEESISPIAAARRLVSHWREVA